MEFVGRLEGDALRAAYRDADVFALPSRYEAYGIALAEAVAWGLPFVAFRVGGVEEVVRGRGALAAPGDVRGFALLLRPLIASAAVREAAAGLSRDLAGSLPSWEETGLCFHSALVAATGGSP